MIRPKYNVPCGYLCYWQVSDGGFFAEIPFADYKGIGRFIRGLPREIEVVGPDELKKYLEG